MSIAISTIFGLAFRRYDDPTPFGLTPQDRLHHVYVIGQTGTGKSTLLSNLAHQDAMSGTGFCLIDPHGDLADGIHRHLNAEHLYWDVADANCPYGYNPLNPVSPHLRPLVASALIETLKKQWPEAWGARMEHILRYSILALLDQPEADLRDIVRLLLYKGYRRQVTDRLSDPQVRQFWKHEFHALNHQAGDGITPVTNKLGALLAHPVVRQAFCTPSHPLKFRSIMDTGQAILINLAKGRLGADISNIVGGVLSSTIMHAAFTRHGLPEAARRPFFLYVDEFHNFTTKAFANLLPEARKYGLGQILAHQHIGQTGSDVLEAVVGNTGSQIVFRVGAQDAPFFARQMPEFSATDFANQPNYRAAVQLMHIGQRLKPFSASMYPPYHWGAYDAC